jgi:hypothetical protein
VPSPTPDNPTGAFDSVIARFDASTLSPLTGEPFTLTLTISLPDGTQVTEWPVIEGNWGPFEIRERSEITQVGQDVIQRYTAVLWRPEDVVTPESYVGYSAGGTDIRRVPVREAFFSVPTVLKPDDEALRPPLPPLISPWPWPEIILACGLLLAAGVVVWSRRPSPPPEPVPSPAQIALGKLRGLGHREPDVQMQGGLAALRDMHQVAPHSALESVIATGEALGYTGQAVRADDAAAFLEFAARAVREAGRV